MYIICDSTQCDIRIMNSNLKKSGLCWIVIPLLLLLLFFAVTSIVVTIIIVAHVVFIGETNAHVIVNRMT